MLRLEPSPSLQQHHADFADCGNQYRPPMLSSCLPLLAACDALQSLKMIEVCLYGGGTASLALLNGLMLLHLERLVAPVSLSDFDSV